MRNGGVAARNPSREHGSVIPRPAPEQARARRRPQGEATMIRRRSILGGAAAAALIPAAPSIARAAQAPGITDTEIKFGNTYPYSGPASAYATIAKAEAAYFRMINEQGGINGRKLNFISYDDAYSPPKTVEQT